MAQKMDPPRPFEVLDVFCGKSKSKAPNAFKFGTKWVTIEVNNWWKFGVDISNHFWEIEIWTFFSFNSLPSWTKNSFRKVFFVQLGRELKEKNVQISISWKWFEISTPNYHQLFTTMKTYFVKNQGHSCNGFGFPAKNF